MWRTACPPWRPGAGSRSPGARSSRCRRSCTRRGPASFAAARRVRGVAAGHRAHGRDRDRASRSSPSWSRPRSCGWCGISTGRGRACWPRRPTSGSRAGCWPSRPSRAPPSGPLAAAGIRLALVGAVLFSLALVGQLADLEHLVAIVISLPFAARLAGPRACAGGTRPSQRRATADRDHRARHRRGRPGRRPCRPRPADAVRPGGAHAAGRLRLIAAAVLVVPCSSRAACGGAGAGRGGSAIVTAAVPVAAAAVLGVALVGPGRDLRAAITRSASRSCSRAPRCTRRSSSCSSGPAVPTSRPGATPSLAVSGEAPDTARELLKSTAAAPSPG